MVLLLLVAVLAAFVVPRFIRPGPRGALASGTLLVTGVSGGAADGDEMAGERFVTISGVINGPTVNEHAVYGRMVVAAGTPWPTTGQQLPVVYSPNNPDNWSFAPPEEPEPLDG